MGDAGQHLFDTKYPCVNKLAELRQYHAFWLSYFHASKTSDRFFSQTVMILRGNYFGYLFKQHKQHDEQKKGLSLNNPRPLLSFVILPKLSVVPTQGKDAPSSLVASLNLIRLSTLLIFIIVYTVFLLQLLYSASITFSHAWPHIMLAQQIPLQQSKRMKLYII